MGKKYRNVVKGWDKTKRYSVEEACAILPRTKISTKWDETVAPGESLAVVVEQGLRLSHLCTGPEVPADIVAADALEIAQAAFDGVGA